MIFDALLKSANNVELKCALEDYKTEPWWSCTYSIVYLDSPREGEDRIPTLMATSWCCHTEVGVVFASLLKKHKTPPWALRLAKVLEPRIQAMLLTGQPTDLRRWIDDGLLEELEEEHHETAQV